MRSTTKKHKLLNRYCAALLALSGGALGNAAQAQATDPAPAAAVETAAPEPQSAGSAAQGGGVNGGGFADAGVVKVTARRREETLQDVPVSVTAFSSEQLARQGATDIVALTTALPNTTMKAARGTNTTLTAFIRGVGQQDPLAGFEAGVGIYVDDIYIARPQAAITDIFDVDRIEVLRGPQGTLYGRNTIGGAVKYVTRRLGPKTDIRVRGTLGNYSERDLVLTASTPLSDTARIGASIARFKRDGFGKNLTNGRDNYDKDISAARLTAEFTPNSDLFVRLSADITQDDSQARNGHRLTVGRTSGAPILDDVYDTRANLTQVLGHEQEVKAYGGSATVEYTINPTLSFKSITAARRDETWAPIDFDSLAVTDFHVPAVYKNRQFSQEFQLTYTSDKLQGVAGFYYLDANAFNQFDTILGGALPTAIYTFGDVDTRAWAVYADANYTINDQWSVSLGGRYTADKREASILRQVYLGAGSPALGNPSAILFRTDTDFTHGELEREDKKFTPKVGVAYKVNGDHNVYATLARGFKGGGFDPRIAFAGTGMTREQALAGYKPETIDTLELGLKSQFAGGRFMTNIALFDSEYKQVQIPSSVAVDTNGDGVDDAFAGLQTNAGKADIRGIELEGMARITDAFSLTGMYSYIDAEYKEFIVAGVNQAANRVFQNTPKNSMNLRASYDIALPLMGHNGKVTLSASASYRGKTYQFEIPSILDQESYRLYDASIQWLRADGRVRAALHGKNLNNERYKTGGYTFSTLGREGTLTAFYGNPRQVQATLEYRF